MSETPPPTAAREAAERTSELSAGGVGLLVLLAGVGLLVLLIPEQVVLAHLQSLARTTENLGWAGPAAFVLAAALLTAVGLPRLVLCSLAGALFGFAWGLLWGQLGTLLGAYATFAVARRSGRQLAFERWPRMQRFAGLLAERGILAVLVMRQLPLSSFYVNLFLGLTAVRHGEFLIGSGIGFLPEAVPATLIGAGVAQGELGPSLQYLALAAVAFVVLAAGLHWLACADRSPARKLAGRSLRLRCGRERSR